MSTPTKITGLTRFNTDALAEARQIINPGRVEFMATTAEWLDLTPAQAIFWLDEVMGRMPTKGHPRASLHAVRRKLAALVPAHEPLKDEHLTPWTGGWPA